MERLLFSLIQEDLKKKMVFITGPRQAGKTFLAKELLQNYKNGTYLNYDALEHKRIIDTQSWVPTSDLLVLDEIHKMKEWKTFIKGTYDTRNENCSILVTGSARLDTFRQSGESLAGRYFHYRLHPFTIRELRDSLPPRETLPMINRFGGFPEPFLSGSEREAKRWRNQYYTDLIREDITDFSRIQEIRSMNLLVQLLRERTGSPISMRGLAEDLQLSPTTVGKYLKILESLYIIFPVRPFHRNIARAILKEPKYYFFDSGYVNGNEGKQLENSVACALLTHCHFIEDSTGEQCSLHYLRTKEGKEVDFLLATEGQGKTLIEVKLSERRIDNNLRFFKERYPHFKAIQIVQNLQTGEYMKGDDIYLLNAADYLADLSA